MGLTDKDYDLCGERKGVSMTNETKPTPGPCERCDSTGCPQCDPEWAQHQRRLTPAESSAIDRALRRSATVVADPAALAARVAELEAALRQFMRARIPVSGAIDPDCRSWSVAYLDQAHAAARALLEAKHG